MIASHTHIVTTPLNQLLPDPVTGSIPTVVKELATFYSLHYAAWCPPVQPVQPNHPDGTDPSATLSTHQFGRRYIPGWPAATTEGESGDGDAASSDDDGDSPTPAGLLPENSPSGVLVRIFVGPTAAADAREAERGERACCSPTTTTTTNTASPTTAATTAPYPPSLVGFAMSSSWTMSLPAAPSSGKPFADKTGEVASVTDTALDLAASPACIRFGPASAPARSAEAHPNTSAHTLTNAAPPLRVVWLNVLLVRVDMRERRLGTMLVHALKAAESAIARSLFEARASAGRLDRNADPPASAASVNVVGMLSPHPVACMILARVFGDSIRAVDLHFIANQSDALLAANPLRSIRHTAPYGVLFPDEDSASTADDKSAHSASLTDPSRPTDTITQAIASAKVDGAEYDGVLSTAYTGRFIDMTGPWAALDRIQEERGIWPLGEVPSGYEYLICIEIRRRKPPAWA